jgi:hypothetical protein
MKGDRAVRSCKMMEDHWNTSTHRLCYNERFDNCGGNCGGTKYEGVIRRERGRPKKRLRTGAESPASIEHRRNRWLESRMDEDIEADPTSPKLVICSICRKEGRWFSMQFSPKGGSFTSRVQSHLDTYTIDGSLTDKQLKKRKVNARAAERRRSPQGKPSPDKQTEPSPGKQAESSPDKQTKGGTRTRSPMRWMTPEKRQRRSTESGPDADDGPDGDGEMGGTLSHL